MVFVQKQQKDKRRARKSGGTEGPSSSMPGTVRPKPSKSGKPDHFRNSAVHEEFMESHAAGVAMQPGPASFEIGSPAKKRMDRFVEVRNINVLYHACFPQALHCAAPPGTPALDCAVRVLARRGRRSKRSMAGMVLHMT